MRILGLLVYLCVGSLLWGTQANSDILKTQDKIELIKAATRLKDAVLQKNIAVINSFLAKEMYEHGLDNDTYAFLYDTKFLRRFNIRAKSVFDILKATRSIELAFEEVVSQDEFGRNTKYIRVFYYDPNQISLKLPFLSEKQRQQWMVKFVTCKFVKTANSWKVAETLFEAETDGPYSGSVN